jgi:hypothetical protein
MANMLSVSLTPAQLLRGSATFIWAIESLFKG